jgi:hypothetical protein
MPGWLSWGTDGAGDRIAGAACKSYSGRSRDRMRAVVNTRIVV